MRSLALRATVLLLAWAPTAWAAPQAFDLGPDVSAYQRFLVYPHLPHLQKGIDLLRRGDRGALDEFERARQLTPRNPVVALYLADAYRTLGDAERARRTLTEQLVHTPRDGRLLTALSRLTLAQRSASAGSGSGCQPGSPACAGASLPTSTLARSASGTHPTAVASAGGLQVARLPTQPPETRAPLSTTPAAASPADSYRQRFVDAVDARHFPEAHASGSALVSIEGGRPAVVDEVSFRLIQAGGIDEAGRVLLSAFPFAGGTPDERQLLMARLASIVADRRSLDGEALAALREPLETPSLRSVQGVLWTSRHDCHAVVAVFGDLSSEYADDDVMRLGDCARSTQPTLAQRAYERAHERQRGGPASLALGYQAHANGDYATAFDAWRSVGPDKLSSDQLIAGASTAVAAGNGGLAAGWLTMCRERGAPLDQQYWAVTAAASEQTGDAMSLTTARERLAALAPSTAGYLDLARASADAASRLQWLERASALDPSASDVWLELSYAYAQSGRAADAETALRQAVTGDPRNARAQLELGYAYLRRRNMDGARQALERAWEADPSRSSTAEELAYVNQQLARNRDARRFAEYALDRLPVAQPDEDREQARQREDRRFGLQRMHEDLGRRLTVNIDGMSGTGVGTGALSGNTGRRYRSYSQMELDVRLGRSTIRDGSTVSLYSRVFADGGDRFGATPTENPRLGTGLRWKPLRRQVLYVAAEYQTSLEGRPWRDLLLRSSASFLNGGSHSDDWHPGGRTWWANNLYLDAAHFVNNRITALTADLRTSGHVKIANRQTLEPLVHIQVNGIRQTTFARDTRVGAGIRWNVWHGRPRYNADPGKVSFGVEYQQAFETYLPTRNGVFVTLGTRW